MAAGSFCCCCSDKGTKAELEKTRTMVCGLWGAVGFFLFLLSQVTWVHSDYSSGPDSLKSLVFVVVDWSLKWVILTP